MSFTSIVKNEICGLDFSNTENIAELSGFIRGNSKFSNDFIELTTENAKVAKRIYMLIKSIYGIEVVLEQRKLANFSNKKIYVVTINARVSDILSDLSVTDSDNNFIEELFKQNNLKDFYGYAAWNTTGNTLGSALACALTYYDAKKPSETAFQTLQIALKYLMENSHYRFIGADFSNGVFLCPFNEANCL